MIFWRFEQIAGVCFLRDARRSISGVWRFNFVQFRESGATCKREEPEAGRTEMGGRIPVGLELPAAPTFRLLHIVPIQA